MRALSDAPIKNGKQVLRSGDLCIRVGDETRVFKGSEALRYAVVNHLAESGSLYAVNEPNFRVLRPDYREFTYRKEQCQAIQEYLLSHRTFVTSLTGIGGVGKTALATWATFNAYERKQFDFIVSLTAKDRALTSTGIISVHPTLSSLEGLIREICDVTGFSEITQLKTVDEQIVAVNTNILSEFRGLLFVDNLETVNDPKIISFLEKLPLPSRAIVTSRKTRVRVAALPIEVGPFEDTEAINFLTHAAQGRGRPFLAELAAAEKGKIVRSCDCIALAIEWFIGRSRSATKAMQEAESLVSQGRHGEELLEFSFRRAYDELPEKQQNILKVISLIGTQLPVEANCCGLFNSGS